LRVLDDPLLELGVVQADVEDVFVVVGGTSQRPAITPGSPEAAGAEREERNVRVVGSLEMWPLLLLIGTGGCERVVSVMAVQRE
jgi:hypothetical protein